MTDGGPLLQGRWRLLDSGPGAPAWNMAVDEALLEGWEEGQPAIVRLYRWSPAALSLGRFQPAGDVEPPEGAVLVRRITGGAAIHHRIDEVTYSVVAPYALFGDRRPRTAYHAIHDVLKTALANLGVDCGRSEAPCAAPRLGMCFERATDYDVTVAGRKLIGSAQRRRGQAFLQHGSLPLSADPLAPSATALGDLLPSPDPLEVKAAIVNAFRSRLADRLMADSLGSTELARAERLLDERYGSSSWTRIM